MSKMKDIGMEETKVLKSILRGIVREIMIEDGFIKVKPTKPPKLNAIRIETCFECHDKFEVTKRFEKDWISAGMCPSCFAKATNRTNWEV